MKKTLLAFTLASMFMTGAAQAVDHSATVDISGVVSGSDDTECSVYVVNPSIVLSGQVDNLLAQGQSATAPIRLDYVIQANNKPATDGCFGSIELQFHGIVDDADGTVLANSDKDAGAAQGVGVGLFDKYHDPIIINDNNVLPQNTNDSVYLQMVKLNGKTPVKGTVHTSMTIDIVRL